MAGACGLSLDLLETAASGDKDRCQLLLSQGADVNGRDGVSGRTCLLYADICEHLIDAWHNIADAVCMQHSLTS